MQAQITRNVEVTGFNKVVFSGSLEVLLVPSQREILTLSGSQKDVDKIKIQVKSNTLYVGFKKSDLIRIKRTGSHIQAQLSYKQINSIASKGLVNIKNKDETLKSDNLILQVEGIGDIDLAVTVKNLKSTISGTGDIKLRGQAVKHEIKVSGMGDINCERLDSDKVDIKISGSGDAHVLVKNSLDVKISGLGDVKYKGNPKILRTRESNSSGKVKKVEKF